jgi:hypothetical protein
VPLVGLPKLPILEGIRGVGSPQFVRWEGDLLEKVLLRLKGWWFAAAVLRQKQFFWGKLGKRF